MTTPENNDPLAASDSTPDRLVLDDRAHPLIGRWLGDRPRIEWMVANAAETAMCYSSESRWEAEDFLARTLRRHPNGWLATEGYHVAPLEIWPNYSSDQDDSVRFVTEALRRIGSCTITPRGDGSFLVAGAGRDAVGRSLAEALLRLLDLPGAAAREQSSGSGS